MTNRYTVVGVQPPNYVHSAAFHEVAEWLLYALRALGQDVLLAQEPVPDRRTIVLGSNLLASRPLVLAPDSILYNLEQIDRESTWLTPALLELFRRFEVWDYSSRNASKYSALGLLEPRVVPIGFAPELTRIKAAPTEDIDVLFYGSLNERRTRVLAELQAAGLRTKVVFGVYGDQRDQLIARSKVVLNVHHYEAKVFEIVRVSYLLANRRCVVSECGADREEERELENGVAFADYCDLVATCVRLCADAEMRARIATEGYKLIAQRASPDHLARALGIAPSKVAALAPAQPVPTYYNWSRPEVVALVQPAGKRVLDVGCAAGAMGAAMLAAGAAQVVGIEVDTAAAATARTRLSAVYSFDLDRLPSLPYPRGYFDVITFADVLEHLRDPAALLRHLRGWLSDTGNIVCSIPNVRHESVLLPLLVQGRWNYEDAGILDRTHLRFFTLDSMLRLLRETGYEVRGNVQVVASAPTPEIARLAELVASLGGDAARFSEEARVIQVLVSAYPQAYGNVRATGITDPWRGSRPVRLLLAPDLSDPTDEWARVLTEVVADLGSSDNVTVGVALPLPLLQAPPDEFLSAANSAQVDLLLIETPKDSEAWDRLFGGATIWLRTSERADLRATASRVGVEMKDLRGRSLAA